ALPLRPRYLVLLDPPADAPPALVPARPRGPPRQPPADGLGSNELPSDRGAERRRGHPRAGLSGADPRRHAWRGPHGHDDHGRHQPHGLGDVSPGPCSFARRPGADNRIPPPPSSRALAMQLRPLLPRLGSFVRHRSRLARPLILGAAAALLTGASAPPQDVSVMVSGLRSAQGKVLACITANPAMFPDCGK